tara:strand:+ start:4302 stop:4652 length:351 start_codon:yes stop_codon:yes gene_type:complete
MKANLDIEKLSTMLKEARGERGLRATAEEIGGISYATLSRIENHKMPDVDTLIRVCAWLGVSMDTFVVGHKPSSREQVFAHLRADQDLDRKTVKTIIDVIDLAYKTKVPVKIYASY